MTARRMFLVLASIVIGATLIALLLRIGKIDVRLTLHQMENINRSAFARLVFLNILLVFISTAKWRSVDAALRIASDKVPSGAAAFVFTSIGMAAGVVLPVQSGMAVARTLGTYFYGRPFKRGAGGTLFEQSFDVLVVCFLAAASGITRYWHGGAKMWTVSAVLMIALMLVIVEPCTRLLRWAAGYAAVRLAARPRLGAELGRLSELEKRGLLNAGLARRLVALSTLRFGVVVLMARETAVAIGAPIALWHLAAVIPFVIFATAIAITPGGIGITEFTYVGALTSFAIPLSTAAQWALANRVLTIAASLIVAAIAITVAVLRILLSASSTVTIRASSAAPVKQSGRAR